MKNTHPVKPLPAVVCIGGGTGTFAVVTALKQLEVQISSVIAVSDSGGSTGRIRDEFGFQPVGDLRQSLAALADPQQQEWIQKILLYRFTKGTGLKGHNLGNLILTALQDMVGDTTQALEIAERIFQLKGSVIPVTETAVDLEITYSDGSRAIGEHILDDNTREPKEIEQVRLVPDCTVNPAAQQAITSAKNIIIGPGDYYASIMACLMVPGMQAAFSETTASIIYISNLMTRRTQTHGMTARQHVEGIETALGRAVTHIVLDSTDIAEETKARYAAEDEHPVVDDLVQDQRVLRAAVAADVTVEKSGVDTAHRSLLRHDPDKLKRILQPVVEK